jgi:putative hydrolase of the HAD superfamily
MGKEPYIVIRNEEVPIKAIIFDIGDTLFNATGLLHEAIKKSTGELYKRGSIDNETEFIKTYMEIDKLIQGPHINHLFSDLSICKRVWEKLDLKGSYSDIGFFLTNLRNNVRKGIRRNEQLVDIIRTLNNKGLKIAIVSDGTTNEQIETLTNLGVVKFFDVIVISEEYNLEKPDPILFEHALFQMGVKPKESLMVGDDPIRDIEGAKKLGIYTIITTQYSTRLNQKKRIKADFKIENLKEVLLIIKTGVI